MLEEDKEEMVVEPLHALLVGPIVGGTGKDACWYGKDRGFVGGGGPRTDGAS